MCIRDSIQRQRHTKFAPIDHIFRSRMRRYDHCRSLGLSVKGTAAEQQYLSLIHI